MMRYERRDTFRTGVIGLAVVVMVASAAAGVQSLPLASAARVYTAEFVDAAGLRVGDAVHQYGVRVGRVISTDLDGDHVDVRFRVDETARVGSESGVAISTATVLGTRQLDLRSAGAGTLAPRSVIPRSRTVVPYDLTAVLDDLTRSTRGIETDTLADSMRALNDVLSQTPAELGPAIAGLGALSKTVADRDADLRQLLDRAEQVSRVLADRSASIAALIGDVDTILGELSARRRSVETLFANVRMMSEALRGVVTDNRRALAPTLAAVDETLALLQRNRENIGSAISSLAPYVTELGEAVASGPFFSSYIANLLPGQVIEPFLRRALADQGVTVPKGVR